MKFTNAILILALIGSANAFAKVDTDVKVGESSETGKVNCMGLKDTVRDNSAERQRTDARMAQLSGGKSATGSASGDAKTSK